MNNVLKWLGVFAGLAMIIIGIYAILHPEITVLSISLYIGIALLLMGIFNILTFFEKRKVNLASPWILTDAFIDIILALLLLWNNFISLNLIPLIFGFWILFLGIERIGLALDIKKLYSPYWKIMLFLGIGAIAFSIIIFIKPILAAVTISVIIGIVLIFYGITVINTSISLGNLYKYFKD